jgi:hypothetical protein
MTTGGAHAAPGSVKRIELPVTQPGLNTPAGNHLAPGPLKVDELGVSGAKARQLDEMLGIEEELIHVPELIDCQPLGPVNKIVQILE